MLCLGYVGAAHGTCGVAQFGGELNTGCKFVGYCLVAFDYTFVDCKNGLGRFHFGSWVLSFFFGNRA